MFISACRQKRNYVSLLNDYFNDEHPNSTAKQATSCYGKQLILAYVEMKFHAKFNLWVCECNDIGYKPSGATTRRREYTASYWLVKAPRLDPARPLVDRYGSRAFRLTRDDAHIVQVIHTNAGLLGETPQVGHVDFCVNGGRMQPSCRKEGRMIRQARCSHFLSSCFFAATISDAGSRHKAAPCTASCRPLPRGYGGRSFTVSMGHHTPETRLEPDNSKEGKAPLIKQCDGHVTHKTPTKANVEKMPPEMAQTGSQRSLASGTFSGRCGSRNLLHQDGRCATMSFRLRSNAEFKLTRSNIPTCAIRVHLYPNQSNAGRDYL
ncbi:hypothetical protein J6590_047781 [Homalodisca vitripennis]|nr:hypothetical protein J6590_047781 [Homalodisca vitripennis]